MSEYNTKNYTEQGGEKTVIGGILEFKEGAQVVNFPAQEGADLPVASADTLGGIKVGSNLSIDENGVLSADSQMPSAATTAAAGIVKMAENQTDSQGSNLLGLEADFNRLLQKLKAAGIMAPDAT